MPDYPSTPHTSPEADALSQEAQRLAIPSSENAYSSDRTHVFGEKLLSIDAARIRSGAMVSQPTIAPTVERPMLAYTPIHQPEQAAMRRAEQSHNLEMIAHTAYVGLWMEYVRKAEQSRSL